MTRIGRSVRKLHPDCHDARASNRRCWTRAAVRVGDVVARARDFPLARFSAGMAAGYNPRLAADRRMPRISIGATVLLCVVCARAEAQPRPRTFAGVVAGIATLAADARSEITPAGADVSLYKPDNGPALNVFLGLHFHDYLTVQANYVWNRNDVTLTSVRATELGPSSYEVPRTSSQHALVGDLLVYFRERRSAVRPDLSAGAGIVRLKMRAGGEGRVRNAVPPPPSSQATCALLRVAVGIDVALGGEWSARYSFSESLSGNPISAQLSPPGQRNLANFQNLFGVVRAFQVPHLTALKNDVGAVWPVDGRRLEVFRQKASVAYTAGIHRGNTLAGDEEQHVLEDAQRTPRGFRRRQTAERPGSRLFSDQHGVQSRLQARRGAMGRAGPCVRLLGEQREEMFVVHGLLASQR